MDRFSTQGTSMYKIIDRYMKITPQISVIGIGYELPDLAVNSTAFRNSHGHQKKVFPKRGSSTRERHLIEQSALTYYKT